MPKLSLRIALQEFKETFISAVSGQVEDDVLQASRLLNRVHWIDVPSPAEEIFDKVAKSSAAAYRERLREDEAVCEEDVLGEVNVVFIKGPGEHAA